MSESKLVNLDNHSIFSAKRSIVKIDDLVDTAASRGQRALALTDDGGIFAVAQFFEKCKDKGIKPIIGAQLNLCDDISIRDRQHSSITLLAKNQEGYSNLCRLITAAYEPTEAFFYTHRIDYAMLEKFAKGLICTLGGKYNPVASALFEHGEHYAEEIWRRLHGIFTMDFHAEINPIENDPEYKQWAEIAVKWNPLNYFITNHVRFMKPEDYEFYDMLICMGARPVRSFDDPYRQKADPNVYMKTEEEIRNADFGLTGDQIEQGLANAMDIVDSVELDFKQQFFFPDPKIFEKDHAAYLRDLVHKGWQKKRGSLNYAPIEIYGQRVEFELEVINRLGYADYFIVVSDIVQWAKDQGIAVGPGRGSAAGCLVSYLLDITTIDPIRYQLIFERFLDPTGQRVSPPDIDIDFQHDRREEVIEYIVKKYGENQVSAVGNNGMLHLKSAMKDVAKAMDVPYDRSNGYTKFVSSRRHKTGKDLKEDKRWAYEINSNQELQRILYYADGVLGTMRQMGKHAAGIIVAPDDILNHTPCVYMKDDDGEYILASQLDKDETENMGLLKIDALALKSLTQMVIAIQHINQRWGHSIEYPHMDNIDFNADPSVFDFIHQGLTGGIFQIEGQGITEMAMRFKPSTIEDVCDLVAIYRPAVLDSVLGETPLPEVYFQNRHRTPENRRVVHETLRAVLDSTYGILLYQEQLMQATRIMANFSLAEADELRRVVGKKKPEKLIPMKDKFMNGCLANGISKHDAEEVFHIFENATRYGFNKSHSLCYAQLACQTAWIKRYYPVEFFTALFTTEATGSKKEEKFALYARECSQMRIEIRQPDINASSYEFTIEDNAIRFGFNGIKNLGKQFAEEVVRLREQHGEFRGVQQFLKMLEQNDLLVSNKAKIEALVEAGAFDSLNANRGQVMNMINTSIQMAKETKKRNKIGKIALFDMQDQVAPKKNARDFTLSHKKMIEKELLGVTFT